MAVRPLGEAYAVDSESGATYVVDPERRSCTCPDHRIRGEVCKHLRRVAIEISTRRVPPPGKRRADCRACGVETFVAADADPPLCADCGLAAGDVVRDRETGDRLVVVGVTGERADAVRVGPEDRPVADFETNADYPADDPVVRAVYLGAYADENPRRYSFPRSRLERVDDAALVDVGREAERPGEFEKADVRTEEDVRGRERGAR